MKKQQKNKPENKNRKKAEKLIRETEKRVRKLSAIPDALTYVKLYQVLQELHFQGRYNLVKKICRALMDE